MILSKQQYRSPFDGLLGPMNGSIHRQFSALRIFDENSELRSIWSVMKKTLEWTVWIMRLIEEWNYCKELKL